MTTQGKLTPAEIEAGADNILRALGYAVPDKPVDDTPQARLRFILPHLRKAAENAVTGASNGARAELAIVARNQDGSGRVGAGFELEPFLADLTALLALLDALTPPVACDRLDAWRAYALAVNVLRISEGCVEEEEYARLHEEHTRAWKAVLAVEPEAANR